MFAFLMNGIPFGTSFMYGGEYVITIYNNNMRRFLLFCMLFALTVLNVKVRLQLIANLIICRSHPKCQEPSPPDNVYDFIQNTFY